MHMNLMQSLCILGFFHNVCHPSIHCVENTVQTVRLLVDLCLSDYTSLWWKVCVYIGECRCVLPLACRMGEEYGVFRRFFFFLILKYLKNVKNVWNVVVYAFFVGG